jgi:hypothetical protein
MNQAFKRSGYHALTFVNFLSSRTTLSCTEYDTGGSSFYGQTIDLQTYSGYESAVCIVGALDYTLSSNVSSSQETNLSAHWVTDTSSAFGGSTTIGSTFVLGLKPSSAQSSEEGVLVVPLNINNTGCYRYIRCLVVVERSSGDGDGPVIAPVYILMGRDQTPTTHNVQVGGAVTT